MTNTKHAMHVQSCSFAYKPINFVFFFNYSTVVAFGRGQGGCPELLNGNVSTSVLNSHLIQLLFQFCHLLKKLWKTL